VTDSQTSKQTNSSHQPAAFSLLGQISLINLHPIPLSSILIISFQLRVALRSGPSPSGFPKNIFLLPMRPTCPAHLILFDFMNRIIFGEEYKSYSSSSRSPLHSPVILSPSSPPYSLTPSSRNATDQVLHPYETLPHLTSVST